MKKLFLLILFFIVCPCFLFAWDDSTNDPEKIYLFDAKITVEQNGEIQVTENITLNVRHEKIRRGIYRDLPDTLKESAKPISLTMDGETHPFFTEKNGKFLRINFGDDNYLSQGKHTYSFTYSYTGAINFLKTYDELYWNVTGNDWGFTIDKAKVEVTFPEGTRVLEEGISMYTGKYGAKWQDAKQLSNFVFETTKPLSPKEGFTIAIPFEKNMVQQPSLLERLKECWSLPLKISVAVFILFTVYCLITWIKVGRDPFLVAVTQYQPPEGVSPALICFDKNGRGSKLLTCIILDLAMKKYISIKEESGQIILYRQRTDTDNLFEENKIMMDRLFDDEDKKVLDKWAGLKLQVIKDMTEKYLQQKIENYREFNNNYKFFAFLFVAVLAFLPFPLVGSIAWFANIWVMVFVFPFLCMFPKIISFIIIAISLLIAWHADAPLDIILCEMLFILGILEHVIYISLIPNLTPLGKEFFAYLKGFEKYVKTAEAHRFEASNPIDAERIFCDYLPYAFAMGLYNKWIKKFTGVLSDATIQQYVERAGGTYVIYHGLKSSIDSSLPKNTGGGSGGSSHGGSFGGGCSGGGHGGGGGGGR